MQFWAKKWLWVFALAIVATAPGATAATRVFIAGDSTASNYSADLAPRMGWGQILPSYFDEQIEVVNLAKPGRSSKSFIAEGWLDKIKNQIQPGDYLLIQFGHNDEKKADPSRYTRASSSFKDFLLQYIEVARQTGATPVLITPVARRKFSLRHMVDTHGDYTEAVLELAQEQHIACIDLAARSMAFFNGIGEQESAHYYLHLFSGEHPNYPHGVVDDTHFQETGARAMAGLVVAGIKDLQLPLAKNLK